MVQQRVYRHMQEPTDKCKLLSFEEVRMKVLVLTLIFGCVALVGCEEFDTPQVTAQSH